MMSMTATNLRQRKALELIGTQCSNLTRGRCSDEPNRSPDAEYLADRWCDECIAAWGLVEYQAEPESEQEGIAFGVFASGAMRAGADLPRCRRMWGAMPLEDRVRWLQRGRDTITYALSYVP